MMDMKAILWCVILLHVGNISTQQCVSSTIYRMAIECVNLSTSPDILTMNGFREETKRIIIQHSNFTSLKANAFQSSYLTAIEIELTDLQVIEPYAFNNIPNLEELSLALNNISTIRIGSFNNLTKLTFLFLSYNNIKFIEKDSFKGTNVEYLHLQYNKIEDMSPLGENCHSLTRLYLQENYIKHIPSLSNCTRLTELNMQNNKIVQLQNNIFPTALSKLNLKYNHIESVEADTFAGLTTLDTLELSNNNLYKLSCGSIPLGLFQPLTGLKKLDLTHNRLSELVNGTFTKLTSLTHLDLGYNCLKQLSSGLLNDLPLTYLSIRNNEFTHLEDNLFNTNYAITIDLDDNEWSCDYLSHKISQLISVNPKNKVIDGYYPDAPNINSIRCNNTKLMEKGSSTDTSANQRTTEVIELSQLDKLQHSVKHLEKETNMLLVGIKDLLANIAQHFQ